MAIIFPDTTVVPKTVFDYTAVSDPDVVVVSEMGPKGDKGDKGDPGGASLGVEWVQATPAAFWVVPRPRDISRMVVVAVWIDGELVETDVTSDAENVYLTFPEPVAGTVVLT